MLNPLTMASLSGCCGMPQLPTRVRDPVSPSLLTRFDNGRYDRHQQGLTPQRLAAGHPGPTPPHPGAALGGRTLLPSQLGIRRFTIINGN